MDDRQRQGHPIISGIIAMVAVCAVVGGILAGGAYAAANVLGLRDDGTTSSKPTSGDTLYLPKLTKIDESDDGFSLQPEPSSSASDPSSGFTDPTDPAASTNPINLAAAETSVAPMQDINLSGTYPNGEGAVLQVQQFSGGAWTDFPVTVSVSNEQFATYIQTGALGKNRFRVVDTDTGEMSNEVRVKIMG